jgi:hypothetical protein
MGMNEDLTRRALVRGGVIAGAFFSLAGILEATSAFAQSPALDPNEPTAKALGYVASSATPDQKSSSCALFQGKAGDAMGGCPIFPGKSVSANGWCKSWTKKP